MSDHSTDPFDRVTYEKPSFIDLAIGFGLLPIVFIELILSFFLDLTEQVIARRFPEKEAKKPTELIDEAFRAIEECMLTHGFTKVRGKRQLLRVRDGISEFINVFGHYRNETGVWAEFSIGFEQTAPSSPISIPFRSRTVVLKRGRAGELFLGMNLGGLLLLPRHYRCNLALPFWRTARIRKATRLVERLGIPWFEGRKP